MALLREAAFNFALFLLRLGTDATRQTSKSDFGFGLNAGAVFDALLTMTHPGKAVQ
jgi:hypothetical protein